MLLGLVKVFSIGARYGTITGKLKQHSPRISATKPAVKLPTIHSNFYIYRYLNTV